MSAWLHILVPAFGPSPYLTQALSSVLAAAKEDTEVTVFDDGSPGPQVRTAARAAGVEYLRSEINLGVAGSFQRCVDHSRGKYTVIMGSDDLVEPWYVEELTALSRDHGEAAMMLPGVTVVDEQGAVVLPLVDRVKRWVAPRGERRLLSGEGLATRLLVGNWLYFPAIAWRTDLLQAYGFRADLQTVLDLDLELRLVFGGQSLATSSRSSFRYRRHAGSSSNLTATEGQRFVEEAAVFAWAADAAAARGWSRAEWAARLHPTSRMHRVVIRGHRALGHLRQGKLRA